MDEQILEQLKNLSYLLSRTQNSIQHYLSNVNNVSFELNQIKNSIDGIDYSFNLYQSKIINQPWFSFVIGALVTLVATYLFDYIKNRKEQKQYLYFLQRILVDQINNLIEIRHTAISFLDKQLKRLIHNIDSNADSAYSMDGIFFPLFSVHSLPDKVISQSSGSGYIDNKLGQVYLMSKDLPYIINDIRLQLKDTLEKNEKLVLGKMNSPENQKIQYKKNIQEFERLLKEDVLEGIIPPYLKKLVETLVAVEKKSKIGILMWKIKFDPNWRLWIKKKDYYIAKQRIIESLDLHFKNETEKKLNEIK